MHKIGNLRECLFNVCETQGVCSEDIKEVTHDDLINTQRAGLMIRMFKLGLLEKKKKGVAVKCSISQSGKKPLNEMVEA